VAYAQETAQRLLAALLPPFTVEEHQLDAGASIGIAVYPTHGQHATGLLRHGDVAMYVAKRSGSGFAVYAPEHDQHSPERLALVGELRQAIDHDELVLHYQPKISLATGQVTGAEALVRWQHAQRGQMPPDQFIALAEQTGLIRPLSRWVLNETLRQCALWRRAGIDVSMAVNLSMRDLHDPDLPEIVGDLLAKWRAVPSNLVLEITENGLMAEPARALDTATRLRALGVHLAIDDFGTGYSSLAYLKRLPVSELKIDQSFVRDMAVDDDDATIVRSTIGLAHDLGLNVVAEGVEDQPTYDLLSRLGCDVAQGYFISRPMTARAFEAWFRVHARPEAFHLAA
jgi:EAL domain-containing protein (putative c-di-GMP-specific phosphodiesterase class I)